MGISISYKEKPDEEKHGLNAVEGNYDFSSKGELKKRVKNTFKSYTCPSCGGHRITGDDLIVEIGKVKFFNEVNKKGLFGRKSVSKHTKNVYRIHNVYLKPSGLLSVAGYIRCKSCKWEMKGRKGVKWISVNDFMNGRF